MGQRNGLVLLFIFIVGAVSVLSLAVNDIRIPIPGADRYFERKGMSLGLDIQGGTHLTYEADLTNVAQEEWDGRMKGALKVIEDRVNAYGIAETTIQKMGDKRISIQLPGVKDLEEAKKLIGQTALLDFREPELDENGQVVYEANRPKFKGIAKAPGKDGVVKELTGKYLKSNSQVMFDPQTNRPEVAFEWDDEGAALFEAVTTRLVGKPLGIFLDGRPISWPVVQSVIRQRGVITGLQFNEGRTLAIHLNAGALPVALQVVSEQNVEATLGADFLRKGLLAGEIGLGVVIFFMVAYYRMPGLMASMALLLYAVLMLAIFKLVPVVLTLSGVAGFILSVGMAVDANVLVFERLKEEIRAGKSLGAALEAGFGRAWPAIRDGNFTTLLICFILIVFGRNLGATLVVGFAITLAIGVVLSMFTALMVTRSLMSALMTRGLARSLLFSPEAQAARKGA